MNESTENKINVLLFYYGGITSTGNYVKAALHRLRNVNTIEIDYNDFHKISLRAAIFCRIMKIDCTPRLSPKIDIPRLLKKLKINPDLIVLIDGSGYPILKGLEKVDVPTAYWAIDSHIKLNYHQKIAKSFDYIFVAQKDYIKFFENVCQNVFWLPLACDPYIFKDYNLNKIYDIVFVGNYGATVKKRTDLLERLSYKYDIHIYNNKYLREMAKIYSQSKIDYYLDNEKEREEIAKNGQKEVHKNHTYDIKVKKMLTTVGLL